MRWEGNCLCRFKVIYRKVLASFVRFVKRSTIYTISCIKIYNESVDSFYSINMDKDKDKEIADAKKLLSSIPGPVSAKISSMFSLLALSHVYTFN